MSIPGHNVVNKLYSIKCMAESHLLQAEEGRFVDAERRLEHAESALKSAYSEADQALLVTRRIRLFHETSSGETVQIAPQVLCSVSEVWQSVRKELQDRFSMEGMEVITRIPEEFPGIVCRKRDLAEILYHLSTNALDAMRNDKIRNRNIEARNNIKHSKFKCLIFRAEYGYSSNQKCCAVLTLADTGPGVPNPLIQNIFAPFVTTKPPSEGNGLGLSIVKDLVHQNSGRISVASSPSGTAFTLEFATV